MIRVLLCEDEPRVQKFISRGLQEAGMSVVVVSSVENALQELQVSSFDILILDRLLGVEDSVSHIPEFKKRAHLLKILVLSAFSDVDQRIHGLQQGADDYLGKPFHVTELVARIQALVRRAEGETKVLSQQAIEFGDLQIRTDIQKVFRRGKAVSLSFQEYRLLVVLASRPDKIFSRSELLARAWDTSYDTESNVIDVTIGRLRRKINLDDSSPLIFPKRGFGYSLSELHEAL